jgi:hypothetical protein
MTIAVLDGDELHITVVERSIVVSVAEAGTRPELEMLADRLNRFAVNANVMSQDLHRRGLNLNPIDDIQLFVERHLVKTRGYWRHLSDPPVDNGRAAGELPQEMVLRFQLKGHVSSEISRLRGIYHKMIPDKSLPLVKDDKRPRRARLNIYMSFNVAMAIICASRALQMYVTGEPFL